MSARELYRRHSSQLKIQICSDIRGGKLGRREALKIHSLSSNLLQMWLTREKERHLSLRRHRIHLQCRLRQCIEEGLFHIQPAAVVAACEGR